MKTRFRKVQFTRFKAFFNYTLDLRSFNILVGPNNTGKSTVIAAFRILSAAMRRARSRRPQILRGPNGTTRGYPVDLRSISVAEENIYYNYATDEPATIIFTLDNGNTLTLYFPELGTCYLIADADGRVLETPKAFASNFDCEIGFVPILGPVEHNEQLYQKEAAQEALLNYRASRNFRNIWHHFPERFDDFRETLVATWPGMDILPPEVQLGDRKGLLYMYCPENRIPREIFWAGFGFQVWCQMLTHLIQSREKSVFLIDEPDIYLHADLQRQLIDLLRNLGPDIIIATHSTEIITEANPEEIVIIDKTKRRAKRVTNPAGVENVFNILGSNINPILTQLAKTRRVIFVEGKDFLLLSRFARKLGLTRVANRSDFAVVPIEGFNPERMKNLKEGIELTLGTKVAACVVLDRDFRSDEQCDAILADCRKHADVALIHRCKEIENFVLIPAAIRRAVEARLEARTETGSSQAITTQWIEKQLREVAQDKKNYVASQYMSEARRFGRTNTPTLHETEIGERVLSELDDRWGSMEQQMQLVPGKEVLSELNSRLQAAYRVNVTPSAIIEQMGRSEMPSEMMELMTVLDRFSTTAVRHISGE